MAAKSIRNAGRERIEVKDLRNFVVVAEEQNFSRAAKRLGIQQSPLSRSIQRLELDMDTVLFNRTGKRTSLTLSGAALLMHASCILDSVSKLYDGAFLDQLGQKIRIGSSYVTTGRTLLSMLQRGAMDASLSLDLQTIPSVKAINFGDFDVVISPEIVQHAGIVEVPLWRENLRAVLPTGHPLSNEPAVTFEQIAAEGRIVCPSDLEFHATGISREVSRRISLVPYVDSRFLECHFSFGGDCVILPTSMFHPIDASIATAKPIVGDGSSFQVLARYVQSGATERLALFVHSLARHLVTDEASTATVRSLRGSNDPVTRTDLTAMSK
jgi:DNA-binding transcriptional LysR family regulator